MIEFALLSGGTCDRESGEGANGGVKKKLVCTILRGQFCLEILFHSSYDFKAMKYNPFSIHSVALPRVTSAKKPF